MKTFTASEVKNESGRLLEAAMREPILITKGKNKRPVAVILAFQDYEELSNIAAGRHGQDVIVQDQTTQT